MSGSVNRRNVRANINTSDPGFAFLRFYRFLNGPLIRAIAIHLALLATIVRNLANYLEALEILLKTVDN